MPIIIPDEQVEAAARACNLEAGRQRGFTFKDDWHTLTEQERGGWRLVARAALEAALAWQPSSPWPRSPVPVQQDEPEDDHWHWLDDRTGRIYHEGDVFGVRSGRDVTLHRLRCTCDPVPEWIVDNAEAKGWDLSPEAAPLPRSRPPRSHRDDESLRRWEARHPSVRFRPTVPLEQECEHVWRSSFGDTFCEKCNQDAPVEVARERCRACKGSGTWADEGWSKPPQPCKACSGSGRVPAKRKSVPVQQDEPEAINEPHCLCPDWCDGSEHRVSGPDAVVTALAEAGTQEDEA